MPAVYAEPVRLEVNDVRMDRGDAVLNLSRKHSKAWHEEFVKVFFSHDVFERVPDGWKYKGKITLNRLGV